MPNFVKIGQSVVKVLRFFDFSQQRPPPLNCRIRKILLADGLLRSIRITVPNFIKIDRSVAEILEFFEFSNCHPRHLGFFNREIFIGVERVETHQRAKFR